MLIPNIDGTIHWIDDAAGLAQLWFASGVSRQVSEVLQDAAGLYLMGLANIA